MARMLIVDDDPAMRDIISQMLERDGHQVVATSDGYGALASLGQRPADLAVIDILMPGMDGIDTIVEIRKHHPGLKILAISGGRRGVSAEFNLESATMLGADGILRKPFDWHELRQALTLFHLTARTS